MNVQSAKARPSLAWLQYTLLLGVFLAVIIAGYFVFRAFAATPGQTEFNLYILAIMAGVASFFSPCAFPLLPSYFSFYHQADSDENGTSKGVRKTLRLGLAASFGVITFALVLGLMIALLGAGLAQGLSISGPEPSQFVRIFRGGVGVVLLILGVGQLLGWNLKPVFADAFAYRTRPEREGKHKPAANLFLYGLGYNAAGMGCTAPILAGLMIFALSRVFSDDGRIDAARIWVSCCVKTNIDYPAQSGSTQDHADSQCFIDLGRSIQHIYGSES